MSIPGRRSHTPASERSALWRALPFPAVAAASRRGRDHWTSRLSNHERARLVDLLRRTHGRRRRLSPGERRELQRLMAQLDVKTLIRLSTPYEAAGRITGRGRGR